MDSETYQAVKSDLIEAYLMLAPSGKIEELKASIRRMESEKKDYNCILTFISSCIHYGLVLQKW